MVWNYQNADCTHTHPFNGLFLRLPGWAGTRKVKPIWILLKQETVSGSGISWAICKCAPRSRQITTPAPHHSVFFTGRMPFLPPNQQRQSTECWLQFFKNKYFVSFIIFFKINVIYYMQYIIFIILYCVPHSFIPCRASTLGAHVTKPT